MRPMGDPTPQIPEQYQPRIGKHTLESLTVGMYQNPLDALREYIQNSVDAIEESGRQQSGRIDITIDPVARRLTIRDNGGGISRAAVHDALASVGRSRKRGHMRRGFRGIGRLGGLAYCDSLAFRTRADGEVQETVQTWDCREMRKILRPSDTRDIDMDELIEHVSNFSRVDRFDQGQGFFEVQLDGVTEASLLDMVLVKNYLAQVAPVDYDEQQFHFARDIRKYLVANVRDYLVVDLLVKTEPVLKPFADSIPMSRGPERKKGSVCDRIKSIQLIPLEDDGGLLAYCWIAETSYKGMVDPDSLMAGPRIRVGNIGIGDGSILEVCFPKSNKRFAGYLVGELHIVAPDVIPNARRDGFENDAASRRLFECIARDIAQEKQKQIRQASKDRHLDKSLSAAQKKCLEVEEGATKGVATETQRGEFESRLLEAREQVSGIGAGAQRVVERINEAIGLVKDAPRLIDVELGAIMTKHWRDVIQGVIDIVYEEAADPQQAERTTLRVIQYLKKVRGGSGRNEDT